MTTATPPLPATDVIDCHEHRRQLTRPATAAWTRKLGLLIGAVAAILCAAVFQARATANDTLKTFKLSNGLEVVVVPNRRSAMVTHTLWYKVGSADDPVGKSGLAHFLEHLMFKGTRAYPGGQFSRFVAMRGGDDNAFTSADFTMYTHRVRREHLQFVMAFEADRMSNLILTDEEVYRERDVVLEEYHSRIGNNPSSRLGEAMRARLYRDNSYGRPVVGWPSQTALLDRNDVLAFFHRYYAPNNAVLVIVGDVTPDEIKTNAERTYGLVEAKNTLQGRSRQLPPDGSEAVGVLIRDPHAQPYFRRTYVVPSHVTAEPGIAEALELLADILGGSTTSRLYRAIVADSGMATVVGVSYNGASLGYTSFDAYAYADRSTDFLTIALRLDQLVQEVAENGVTVTELDNAKRRSITNAYFAKDSQTTIAWLYGVALATGAHLDYVQTLPDRFRAVTNDDIKRAARLLLVNRRTMSGYLLRSAANHENDETNKP